jgi:hypothetical protein
MSKMKRKTEDPGTEVVAEGGRRYRSIAEIRRDFFPDAPVRLFEIRVGRPRQEVTPHLTSESRDG